MPDRPGWMNQSLEILDSLAQREGLLHVGQVAELLGLKKRAAQEILATAGARLEGKAYVIEPEALAQYLRVKAGPDFERHERARRKRLAGILAHERQRIVDLPHGPKELGEWKKDLREVYRNGLDGLPGGVELGPGYITVRFESIEDGLLKLMQLAEAIGRDLDEAGRRTGVHVGSPSPRQGATCPVCAGVGFLCRATGRSIGECGCGQCERGPEAIARCPECLGKRNGKWVEIEDARKRLLPTSAVSAMRPLASIKAELLEIQRVVSGD